MRAPPPTIRSDWTALTEAPHPVTSFRRVSASPPSIALDLSTTDAGDKKALDALKACSSDSRFRMDPTDPTKPAKLFWNATGATLSDNFKEIANELSNLRIVG